VLVPGRHYQLRSQIVVLQIDDNQKVLGVDVLYPPAEILLAGVVTDSGLVHLVWHSTNYLASDTAFESRVDELPS
jgi:hypothetical protein